MNEPHDLNLTADLPSATSDSLDAGLAAGFGRRAEAPRSSLGAMRPVLLKEAEGESNSVVKPRSDAMPTPEQTGERYRLDGEIARGGMGAVLRGRDVDLGRDLAVKVLLDKYTNRPEVARRFIEEAQIGGQLQHPGVVPVYDIGRFGDRPFFTMKLVKGQTLSSLLAERADHSQERPRLLGVTLQVAQTLAYAHAKGVIHRDLKPANIMVGAFGEVQVMDWGLAKVLAEGGIADEERAIRAQEQREDVTKIRTVRSSGSTGSFGTDTEAGSLLGTPAYMPPEQANGEIAHLDRRADVFGLGAILCEILTGQPPYVGRSSEEVRRKAANGDLADAAARLDACGADQELIALTKGCLAPEAIDRPKDAQAVADGLSAYLNGVQERLQAAERERAVAVAREAEQRKRRKVQLALAAALVGLLLGGGAFAFWRNEQTQLVRQREGRNAEAVAALLGQAEEALRADDAAKAAVVLDAVRKRSAEGGAEKEAERLGRLDADLALLRDLGAVDQFRWTIVENKLPDAAVVAKRTREALARFGADPDAVSTDDATARVSASVVRERIVAALDRLLRQEKTAGVRTALRRLDADPYRDAVRDGVFANDHAKMVELAGQPAALEQPPGFVAFMGYSQAIKVERRRQLLERAVGRRPGDLGLLMTLGFTYWNMNNQKDGVNERLRWFQAAVAAAPANSAVHVALGNALADNGQLDEAIARYNKAIELDPKHAIAHNDLGNTLQSKGQLDEAIDWYKKAIELDPKFAAAHGNLGVALDHKGQLNAAIDCYKKAIEVEPEFAWAHDNLGLALARKGQVDAAIDCYKMAIELDPKRATAHFNLGVALQGKGQLDEAIVCFHKAIELDPKRATAHCNLGNALAAKGQLDESIACFHTAIGFDPKLAVAHCNLGNALKSKGQLDEAIDCFNKAIELDPKDAKAHYNLGNALEGKGQLNEAIDCFNKAIELAPKYATAHYNLGNALAAKGQLDEAIARYKKAIELDPKLATAHCNLGNALAAKGQLDESIACFHTAIGFDPKLAVAHCGLGYALEGKGQLDEAIACYKKAIELDPKLAAARNNLGHALRRKGIALGRKRRLDEAIDCFRQAIELDPQLASARNNLGLALQLKGQLDEAIACYNKAIDLDPKDPTAHGNLGIALERKGQLDEAIACYNKAIELDPKVGDTMLFEKLAVLQAWVGQDKELAVTCQRGLKLAEGATIPQTADRIAKACCLRPTNDKAQREASLALARRAVELGKNSPVLPYFKMALGMAEYRNGNFAAADEALVFAVDKGPVDVSPTAAFYRAMSLFRQGKKAEAGQLATKAAAKMKPLPADEKKPFAGNADVGDLIMWMAYKEARALIQFDPPRGETPKDNTK